MSRLQDLKYRFNRLNIAEKLIVINLVCFVIPFFVRTLFFLFKLPQEDFYIWFELSPQLDVLLYRPWTLISYGFLHGGIGHILWNMLLLYYSSQIFLNLFSEKRFINVYFLGILTGGLIFVISYAIFPVFKGMYPPLVGASAGVMSVLIFMSTYTPNQEVRLLFFNVKLMYIGIALVLIDMLQIPSGNAGGHIAHLGGALWGYLFASQLQNGNDLGAPFERLLDKMSTVFTSRSEIKTVYRSSRPKRKTTHRPSNQEQEKIDAILDKISDSGYDSLTKAEKDFLFKAGKK